MTTTAPAPTAAPRRPRVTVHRRVDGQSIALRRGALSVVLRPRVLLVDVALVLLLVAVSAYSLSVGDFPIPVADVLRTLVGQGDGSSDFIVLDLRLPRLVCGLLVGAAFGAAGALTQSVARNALASPDVLGVTAGASAAAVAVIVLGGPGSLSLSGAALVGGFVTAVAVYALAYRNGVTGARLVLVGIGLSSALVALTDFLLQRAKIEQAQAATVWLTGSLNGRGWDQVRTIGIAVAVLLPLALLLTRSVGVLQFGDDTARGLGVRGDVTRSALLVLSVGLAALATAAAGPIAFVALASPQIALRLVRTPGLPLLTSAFVGALLVTLADLVARRMLAPTELPVGVVTAVLGAPFLLWLLSRATRHGGKP